jgi:Ca2+-transporting ATPase
MDWHSLSKEEVLTHAGSSLQKGLNAAQVEEHRKRFGANRLAEIRGVNPFFLFLQQFHQPLVYILLAAGTITFLLKDWVDTGVILGVVVLNAVVGFLQESKAMRAVASLSRSLTREATVIRDGRKQRIPAEELTVGDVVLLQSGDKVPADIRLFEVRELRIDESALTGESLPVNKEDTVLPPQTPLADRSNMAYSSTLVNHGTAVGIVVAVGDQTEIGKIGKMIESADILTTPLMQQIARFSSLLLFVIIAIASLIAVLGFVRGERLIDVFLSTIAFAVSTIPEGLPATLTIILAIGVAKMAKQGAIIRKLPAVETLGSASVICSDKTGTLTQNQMTVQKIAAGGSLYHLTGIGYAPQGEIESTDGSSPLKNLALRECLIAGILCNEARLIQQNGTWQIEGDPTEGALLTAGYKGGFSLEALTEEFPRLDVIPFESQHQYMATLHEDRKNGQKTIYLKGSAERVLAACRSRLLADGTEEALDIASLTQEADTMAGEGFRLLALARRLADPFQNTLSHDDVQKDLTFLGFQGMIDPPRPEVPRAIETCHKAGIEVKMITGDHRLTAFAIARKIGIVKDPHSSTPAVLEGKDLAQLSDEELVTAAEKTSVFARVVPEQKLRLVQAIQARKNVVAMTGDGVNDAPSLRQADIGVAMGMTGVDVVKEVADMVIVDDNFATIEAAVEEGRGIYDNIKKFITWTLPTNVGEGLVILTSVIVGSILPILPAQILWVNLTTAILLGMTLAFEPKEPGIMERPPRDPKEPLLTPNLAFRIFLVGAILCLGALSLFFLAIHSGRTEEIARTIAVNFFVVGELFYLFNCRSLYYPFTKIGVLSNPPLLLGASVMVVLQLLYTYLPLMHTLFQSQPITALDWLSVCALSALLYGIIELEKTLRRSRRK